MCSVFSTRRWVILVDRTRWKSEKLIAWWRCAHFLRNCLWIESSPVFVNIKILEGYLNRKVKLSTGRRLVQKTTNELVFRHFQGEGVDFFTIGSYWTRFIFLMCVFWGKKVNCVPLNLTLRRSICHFRQFCIFFISQRRVSGLHQNSEKYSPGNLIDFPKKG